MSDDEKYEEFSDNESIEEDQEVADPELDQEEEESEYENESVTSNVGENANAEVDEDYIEEDENDNENEYEDKDEDEDEDNEQHGGKKKSEKDVNTKTLETNSEDYETDEESDDYDDDPHYLQKFNSEINRNYLEEAHPECIANNYEEIALLTNVIRDAENNIIDPLHRTLPYLTKYEKTRIVGYRAKQINSGAKAFVKVPEHIMDGYLIAEMELKQKRIPFILRRPIPGGGCEYWNIKDLELVSF
jgi:DNA-directed RNA polymerase subunit K/omega